MTNHGRLIDADALINELNNSHYPGAPYVDAGISIAIGKVCDAPTIEERKWIPCNERLPEEGQGCLVCDKGSISIDTFIGHGNPYNWKWCTRDYEAWMPLPEPYREDIE